MGNGKAFLTLFGRLAALFPKPDSCSIIWSNVAKIGSREGNPEGILLSAQKDLAERTMRREIEEYDPVLVVFATSKYAGDVIKRALTSPMMTGSAAVKAIRMMTCGGEKALPRCWGLATRRASRKKGSTFGWRRPVDWWAQDEHTTISMACPTAPARTCRNSKLIVQRVQRLMCTLISSFV